MFETNKGSKNLFDIEKFYNQFKILKKLQKLQTEVHIFCLTEYGRYDWYYFRRT